MAPARPPPPDDGGARAPPSPVQVSRTGTTGDEDAAVAAPARNPLSDGAPSPVRVVEVGAADAGNGHHDDGCSWCEDAGDAPAAAAAEAPAARGVKAGTADAENDGGVERGVLRGGGRFRASGWRVGVGKDEDECTKGDAGCGSGISMLGGGEKKRRNSTSVIPPLWSASMVSNQ